MEREKCYRFEPQPNRPAKRRRVDPEGLDGSRDLREELYKRAWAEQEGRIERVKQEANQATSAAISDFISSTSTAKFGTRIPCGFIVTGPSNGPGTAFFEDLSSEVSKRSGDVIINLRPEQCPNLKTLLKTLILEATSAPHLENDDDESAAATRGAPSLNYDLDILVRWLQGESTSRVIIALQQVEAISGTLIAEAIELFHYWLPKIPFVLLFGIGTSLDFFEDRLPKSAARCLKGLKFEVAPANEVFERVFLAATADPQTILWTGAAVSDILVTRQKESMSMVSYFEDGLKYAYMSHFFANALSIFLSNNLETGMLSSEHYEAVRNLPSFKRQVEMLLDAGDVKRATKVLQSDEELQEHIKEGISQGRSSLQNLTRAVCLIALLRNSVSRSSEARYSDLFTRAMAGSLKGSPLVRDVLLSIRKVSSDVFLDLINTLTESRSDQIPLDGLTGIAKSLKSLLSQSGDSDGPMRSAHDVRRETMRTTVVSQKVELSKQKATLSKQDTAYSKLVDRFHTLLVDLFEEALIKPDELFLSEILTFDLARPYRDVLISRPRHALERALSAPSDFLACECCPQSGKDGSTNTVSPSLPPSAILYQLHLESGSLINVADLWTAFRNVLDGKNDDEANLMLFQRGLAELRYLGMIKGSKKKSDHIAKLLWKGV